jgi:hypothetical protein
LGREKRARRRERPTNPPRKRDRRDRRAFTGKRTTRRTTGSGILSWTRATFLAVLRATGGPWGAGRGLRRGRAERRGEKGTEHRWVRHKGGRGGGSKGPASPVGFMGTRHTHSQHAAHRRREAQRGRPSESADCVKTVRPPWHPFVAAPVATHRCAPTPHTPGTTRGRLGVPWGAQPGAQSPFQANTRVFQKIRHLPSFSRRRAHAAVLKVGGLNSGHPCGHGGGLGRTVRAQTRPANKRGRKSRDPL